MTQIIPQMNDIGHAESTPREGTRVSQDGLGRNGNGADAPHVPVTENGAPAPAPVASDATPSDRMQQAEVLADQIARRVATFTATLGRGLFRFGARIREEAEDVWAEAQNIRHGKKS